MSAPYLGPLLANLKRLENYGENFEATLAEVIEERGFENIEAVLAVIHYRIASRVSVLNEPTGQRDTTVALLERSPRLSSNYADAYGALNDREQAIQIRAELLLDEAIADDEPWVKALVALPIGSEAQWRTAALRVATYRDHYGVYSAHPVDSLS